MNATDADVTTVLARLRIVAASLACPGADAALAEDFADYWHSRIPSSEHDWGGTLHLCVGVVVDDESLT